MEGEVVDASRAPARSYLCRNHPDREGIGICVICRDVVCVECSTKIDGVNHCKTCLAKRAGTAVARSRTRAGGVVQAAVAVVLSLVSVVALSGVLVVWGAAFGRGGRSDQNRQRVRAVASGVESFRRHMGRLPTESEGLSALVRRPDDDKDGKWRGPYIETTWEQDGTVRDIYGRELRYRVGKAPAVPTAATAGSKPVWAWTQPAAIGSAGEDGIFESDQALQDFIDQTSPWPASAGDDEIETVR